MEESETSWDSFTFNAFGIRFNAIANHLSFSSSPQKNKNKYFHSIFNIKLYNLSSVDASSYLPFISTFSLLYV